MNTVLGGEKARQHVIKTIGANIDKELDRLIVETKDESLKALVNLARPHLKRELPLVYEAKDRAYIYQDENGIIHHKPAVSDKQSKQMYMTMGGSGSGKSGLAAIAKDECGKDALVIASFDDARGESDRYWLYAGTNNHKGDYKAAELFGNAVRDLITRQALENGYHILIDGSGIPYENRNDKTVKAFREAGFDVFMLGAQAPVYVNDPEKRHSDAQSHSAPNDAFKKTGARLVKDLRGLDPEIVAAKHIGFALASRNAARDPNIDRYLIQDVSGDGTYTLSYVETLKEEEMKELVELHGKALAEKLRSKHLPRYIRLPGPECDDLYDLKVIRDNKDGTYRVEIITDIEQYTAMVQKGMLKRNAKGPEALFDNTMHADVRGYFQGEGGRMNFSHGGKVPVVPFNNHIPPAYISASAAQSQTAVVAR